MMAGKTQSMEEEKQCPLAEALNLSLTLEHSASQTSHETCSTELPYTQHVTADIVNGWGEDEVVCNGFEGVSFLKNLDAGIDMASGDLEASDSNDIIGESHRLKRWKEAGMALRQALGHLTKDPISPIKEPEKDLAVTHSRCKAQRASDRTTTNMLNASPMEQPVAHNLEMNGEVHSEHCEVQCPGDHIPEGVSDPMNLMWDRYHVELEHPFNKDVSAGTTSWDSSTVAQCSDCPQDATTTNAGSPFCESCIDPDAEDNKEEPSLADLTQKLHDLKANLPQLKSGTRSPLDKGKTKKKLKHCKSIEIGDWDTHSEDDSKSPGTANQKVPKHIHRRKMNTINFNRTHHKDSGLGAAITHVTRSKPCKKIVGASRGSHAQQVTGLDIQATRNIGNVHDELIGEVLDEMSDSLQSLFSASSDSDHRLVQMKTQPYSMGENILVTSGCKNKASSSHRPGTSGFSKKADSTGQTCAGDGQHAFEKAISHLKQTESVANFADIESCTSERETIDSFNSNSEEDAAMLPVGPGIAAQLRRDMLRVSLLEGAIDHALELGMKADSDHESLASTSTEELTVAAQTVKKKYKTPMGHMIDTDLYAGGTDTPEGDTSDFLFDDLPDLLFSSHSDSDGVPHVSLNEEEIESLPDIVSISSSESEEDKGMDADDEFECDCPMCHYNRDRRIEGGWITESEEEFIGHQQENDITYHVDNMLASSREPTLPFGLADLSPLDTMMLSSDRREVLELMFQNVIMQMLSVYPDLMTDQAPPPIPTRVFEHLSSVNIEEPHLVDECSCPICLCPFEVGESAKQLPCAHFFHKLCIKAWLQKSGTCPVCRHVLTGISSPGCQDSLPPPADDWLGTAGGGQGSP